MSSAAAGGTGFRYPYVIGFTGEALPVHHLEWKPRSGRRQLSYALPRGGDWSLGVLRLRQNQTRAGRPDFTSVNTRRQWRCMDMLR